VFVESGPLERMRQREVGGSVCGTVGLGGRCSTAATDEHEPLAHRLDSATGSVWTDGRDSCVAQSTLSFAADMHSTPFWRGPGTGLEWWVRWARRASDRFNRQEWLAADQSLAAVVDAGMTRYSVRCQIAPSSNGRIEPALARLGQRRGFGDRGQGRRPSCRPRAPMLEPGHEK
jgi:hypothetical protein